MADRAATAVPAPAPAVPVAIRRVPDRGPVAGRDRDRTAPVPAPDRELRHRAVPSHGRHLSRAERDRQVSSIDAGSPGKCDPLGSILFLYFHLNFFISTFFFRFTVPLLLCSVRERRVNRAVVVPAVVALALVPDRAAVRVDPIGPAEGAADARSSS